MEWSVAKMGQGCRAALMLRFGRRPTSDLWACKTNGPNTGQNTTKARALRALQRALIRCAFGFYRAASP